MDKQKPTLQTVDRALELIDIMACSSDKMSVIEISKALGITRTGAYTLLNSLMKHNFVEKDPSSNKYFIGYKFLELGACYRHQYPFVLAAERGIYSLSRKWKHQINLSIYKQPCLTVLLLIKAPEETQRNTQRVVLPAYITAGGKLLLAYLPEEELKETLKNIELRQFAKNTITDKNQLMNELTEIRQQGYAVEREESRNLRGCIATPIRDMSGEIIASLSMTMMLDRMDDHFDQFLEDLLNTGREISQEVGFNPYQQQ